MLFQQTNELSVRNLRKLVENFSSFSSVFINEQSFKIVRDVVERGCVEI